MQWHVIVVGFAVFVVVVVVFRLVVLFTKGFLVLGRPAAVGVIVPDGFQGGGLANTTSEN